MNNHQHALYMALALSKAQQFAGATAPNPPVGACVVLADQVLAVAAHEKAGTQHAEAKALDLAIQSCDPSILAKATLYVTLEPCNHVGKTPACTEKIISSGIGTVIYGVSDANPAVKGGGAAFLRKKGVSVNAFQQVCSAPALDQELSALIRPFEKFCKHHKPYIVHKLAYRKTQNGQMTLLPEDGKKTFTSQESLNRAHLARRQSDAIITGIGTVLADKPYFNVRHVVDHPGKKRILAVLSSSGASAPKDWVLRQETLGFNVKHFRSFNECIDFLAKNGVLQALIEAGPKLSAYIEEHALWDERLLFLHDSSGDFCYTELACSQALSKK